MHKLTITCEQIIESFDGEKKATPTNFIEKKAACKTQNFYILTAVLFITIALLIAGNIYCF